MSRPLPTPSGPPDDPPRSARRRSRRAGVVVAAAAGALLVACGTAPPTETGTTTPPFSNPIRSAVPATGTSTTTARSAPGVPTTVEAPSPDRDPAWTSVALDAPIDARPVAFGSLLVVATRNNSLYGLDQATGAVRWGPVTIGPAVLGAHLHELGVPEACTISEAVGITSAPVVDPATGVVYAVAEVQTPGDPVPLHQLVGLDAATGAPVGAPRAVDPPGAARALLWQRAGLTLANGFVYVAFGGFGADCGDVHGWIVAEPVPGAPGDAAHSYEVAASTVGGGRGGSISAPPGPVIGPGGRVYVATGPGVSSPPEPAYDRTNGVIALSPTLDEVGFWAPSGWRTAAAQGLDVGATSPVLLPDGRLFQLGTNATGAIVATDRADAPSGGVLGGIGGEAASLPLCPASGGGAFADPAVFFSCPDGLRAVKLDLGSKPPVMKPLWQAAKANGTPVVDGTLVWAVSPDSESLMAFVRESGQLVTVVKVGPVSRATTPTVANDRVFVASADKVVAVTSGAKGTGEGASGDDPTAPQPVTGG